MYWWPLTTAFDLVLYNIAFEYKVEQNLPHLFCLFYLNNYVFLLADFPDWLVYFIAGVCGMLALAILTCILVCCLQLIG